ncbi:MAG: hypothetical protein K2M19_00090 [Muribaculaceae bacterium]|nr:hypothetical protein [Muribaculaceae bacterium]
MTTANIIRFTLLFVAWGATVALLVATRGLTPYIAFVIVASAIIVFVPVYKKYVKNDPKHTDKRH